MSGEIAKPLNADDYIKPVREKIKDTFASLIPDEQWESLCKNEFDNFFIERRTGYDGRDRSPSLFSGLVEEVLKEKSKELIKGFLDDPKYSVTKMWQSNQLTGVGEDKFTMSEYMETKVMEALPKLMLSMFEGMIKGSIYTVFQNLRNNGQLH